MLIYHLHVDLVLCKPNTKSFGRRIGCVEWAVGKSAFGIEVSKNESLLAKVLPS